MKCPYCKFVIQEEVKKCSHCGNKLRFYYRHPIWSVVVGFVLFVALFLKAFSNVSNTPSSLPVNSEVVSVGEEGKLKIDSLVAVSEDSFKELQKLASANDKLGITQMTVSEKLFFVPENTHILVIGVSLSGREVRILEGKYLGKSGWVPYTVVTKN